MTRCHDCAGLASEKVLARVYINCSLRAWGLAAWIGVWRWRHKGLNKRLIELLVVIN